MTPYLAVIGGGAVAGLIGGAVAEHVLGQPSADAFAKYNAWHSGADIPANVEHTLRPPDTTGSRNLVAALGVALLAAGGIGTYLITRKAPMNPGNLLMIAATATATIAAAGVGATAGSLGGYALLGPKA
jgi:hypothetical protein